MHLTSYVMHVTNTLSIMKMRFAMYVYIYISICIMKMRFAFGERPWL